MSKAGKALKQVLETYGISQNQLAATMGIGRSSINRWVNENQDPASEVVLKIRKGLQKINPQAAIDFISLYRVRRHEQLSLLLGDLMATHHTNYNGDELPGFGITT